MAISIETGTVSPSIGASKRYRTTAVGPSLGPVRVAVIGYGYWGPNLARNFAEVPGAELVAISDRSPDRLEQAMQRYPTVYATADCQDVFADPTIEAVIIATPVSTHFRLGMEAVQAGKHVLMSKPLVDSSDNAIALINEAARRQRVLMVDHTFLYTGAVRKIKELIDDGSVGNLYYYDSVRVNLGLFQSDVDVLWDLAVHDLAIMDYILDAQPRAVAATGAAHVAGHPTNMAYLTCFFDDNLIAHHHVNWLAPVKIRRTLIGGDRQMVVYDDLEPSDKVKVYDKGVMLNATKERVYESLVGYRTGDMWAPQVSATEGLRVEASHFVDCVRNGHTPLTDGYAGLRVVRVLEAAAESLAHRGQPVEVASWETDIVTRLGAVATA